MTSADFRGKYKTQRLSASKHAVTFMYNIQNLLQAIVTETSKKNIIDFSWWKWKIDQKRDLNGGALLQQSYN